VSSVLGVLRRSRFPALGPLACADIEHLPFARNAFDMVWSNLTLQWLSRPDEAFAEFARVLRPEGLLLFSTLGPDTLMELRSAFSALDGFAHVNRFLDMHDVGDALVRAGFASPVMDVEHLTLTYHDVHAVIRDLRGIGAHTVGGDRRRGMMGRRDWACLVAGYEAFRRDGRLPATFEVVHGHAWAGEPRPKPGAPQVIRLDMSRKHRP
jgi:malonyl-CoA O-methyltransferase